MRILKLIFASAVASALFLSCAQPTIEPVGLRCEYAENPLIDIQNPRLSWINTNEAEVQGAAQSAYQVQVALGSDDFKNLVWDSGKVESDESAFIEYAGEELDSRNGMLLQKKQQVHLGTLP